MQSPGAPLKPHDRHTPPCGHVQIYLPLFDRNAPVLKRCLSNEFGQHRSTPMPGSVSPKPKNARLQLPTYFTQGSHATAYPLPQRSPVSMPRKPRKILYLCVIFFFLYWFGIRHGLGIERVAPPPLGYAIKGGRKGRRSSLSFLDNGMAALSPNPAVKRQEHPIYELMEKGEQRWMDLLERQSTTLEQAAKEYKRRYGISPPAGFDAWFSFCQANGIKIVDEYDQMMKDVLPHHALSPDMYNLRTQELKGQDFTYTLDIGTQGVVPSGARASSARPQHMQTLIDGFRQYLPRGFRLQVSASDHDVGSVVLGRDQRERAMQLVKQGKRACCLASLSASLMADFDADELRHLEDPRRTKAWGWFVSTTFSSTGKTDEQKACPLSSPANSRPEAENAPDESLRKSELTASPVSY